MLPSVLSVLSLVGAMKYMIKKGATDFNKGLTKACRRGDEQIVKLNCAFMRLEVAYGII